MLEIWLSGSDDILDLMVFCFFSPLTRNSDIGDCCETFFWLIKA